MDILIGKNKKAIVFGITGMDSRTITYQLLDSGYTVVGTYRSNTDSIENIKGWFNNDTNLTLEFCDIKDYQSVNSLLKKHVDTNEIYLLAAQSHVGKSFEAPIETAVTNGMSVFNVLDSVYRDYVLKSNCKIYFAATSELFGGSAPSKNGYNESCEYDCRSPYSIGKEMGTRWVKYYRQLGVWCCYGVLFNHSNIFRNSSFYVQRVANSAALIANGKLKELTLGNLNFYRDEHWSDFGVEMMIKMLNNSNPKDYVIATGRTNHGEEYLESAFKYFNLDWRKYVKIDKSIFRPNEVVKLIGDSTLAQNELGWNPSRMTFESHMKEMCEYNNYVIINGCEPKRKNYLELYN